MKMYHPDIKAIDIQKEIDAMTQLKHDYIIPLKGLLCVFRFMFSCKHALVSPVRAFYCRAIIPTMCVDCCLGRYNWANPLDLKVTNGQ